MSPIYASLAIFVDVVNEVNLNVWWVVCKTNPHLKRCCCVMVRLITGNHNLNCGRRQYTCNTRRCQLCDGDDESVCHFLFECQRLTDRRKELWSDVELSMPRPMVEEIGMMNNQAKVTFILSGFGCKYVPEWNSIYVALVRFVSNLYALASDLRPVG